MSKSYALVFENGKEVDTHKLKDAMSRIPRDYVGTIREWPDKSAVLYTAPVEIPEDWDLNSPIVCTFNPVEVIVVT